MALSKTITTSMQYANNATSPSAVSLTTQPIVADGKLINNPRVVNPGVFTFGTADEGYTANTTQDSNN